MTAANDPSFSAATPGGQASTDTKATSPPPEATAIQSSPAEKAADSSIPLPPILLQDPEYGKTTPERLADEITRLDWALGAVVLVLAFLVSSFAVRNSDFWQHLAAGRLYAHGQFNFGVDPFTYTATNSYWVNHSWLYDWILYGLARILGGPDTAFGGAVLVVLKALLITAVAWLMLKTSRPGQSLWAPAFCSLLALLAMSPRLLYQPTLVSLLFLSLTLYLLQRPRHEEGDVRRRPPGSRSPLASYWLLVPLFVLWVNMDSWFLLGPLTVALFLVGQLLQQVFAPVRTGEDAPEPNQLTTLALVLVAGLAACLINPHHYKAFTLPPLMSPATPVAIYEADPLFRLLFDSPFGKDTFLQDYGIAGGAYYALLGLGLVSFILSYFQGWRWWRFLVWLAFAALGAYQLRNIPFFAVVAGPVTALNLQDFAARRFGPLPRVEPWWKAWSLGGRIVTILAGLVLLLAAWPGWLQAGWQGRPSDARLRYRVAWKVDVDPSFRKTSEQLHQWRTEGLLQPGENGFNYLPDLSNYWVWFCADEQGLPLEKGFWDYRMQIFPEAVAKQYVDLRLTLLQQGEATDSTARQTNWQDVFRKQNISHVVLPQTGPIWHQFLRDWKQWSLVYQDGRSCIFQWHDPRPAKRVVAAGPGLKRFDPNPLAFGPEAVPAPAEGPGRAPQLLDIYTRYLHGVPPTPLEAEEVERYNEYFDVVRNRWPGPYLIASEFGFWTATIGAATASPASGTMAAPATWITQSVPMRAALFGSPFMSFYLLGQDLGPAAAPLLAVRAARRAIKANPDDAQAYLNLAKAYNHLLSLQEEHWVGRPQGQELNPRQKVRQVQMVAALEHCLKLRPDDAEAHEQLFRNYLQAHYQDLALDHLREAVKLAAAAGPNPNILETRDDFKNRIENMQKTLKNFDAQVTRERNEYEIPAVNQSTINKARIALSKQLGKKALDVLLDADPSGMDIPEATLQLFLLLSTGRSEDARLRLEDPDSQEGLKEGLGANYEWYLLLMEAADGNYRAAGKALDKAIARLEKIYTENSLVMMQMQTFMGQGVGNLQAINTVMDFVHRAANYRVLRGMLLLEEGDPTAAARYFQQALDMNNGEPWEFESRAIAVHYLKHIRAAQK